MNKFLISYNSESNIVKVINAINVLSQVINQPTIELTQEDKFDTLRFCSEESLETIKNILNSNTEDDVNWIVEFECRMITGDDIVKMLSSCKTTNDYIKMFNEINERKGFLDKDAKETVENIVTLFEKRIIDGK